MKPHRFWTMKRRAFAASYFSVAAGAAVAKWVDIGTGIALMMAGVFAIGKLMRETLPDKAHPEKDAGPS